MAIVEGQGRSRKTNLKAVLQVQVRNVDDRRRKVAARFQMVVELGRQSRENHDTGFSKIKNKERTFIAETGRFFR